MIEYAEAPKGALPRMKPEDRQAVILCMFLRHSHGGKCAMHMDCLCGPEIDEYCEVCNIEPHWMIIGPNKCKEFNADLLALYERGILRRFRSGCRDMPSGGGWPKWVWSYSFVPDMIESAKRIADWYNETHPNNRVRWDYSKP